MKSSSWLRTAMALLGAIALLPASVARGEVDMRSSTRTYSASAYSLDMDELVYVERHLETWRKGQLAERAVTYEDAQGRIIAEKEVRYGLPAAAPSFEMTDYRTGLVESAQVGEDSVDLFSGFPEEGDRSKTVALPQGAVVDAGFDAFMRENFSEIFDGRKLEFDFAVPSAGRFFRFELVPRGELSYQGIDAIRVLMKPANAFLRLLVDPIELVYDRSGRLLEFRGLSNVADNQGDRYKARIVFEYPEESEFSVAAPIAR